MYTEKIKYTDYNGTEKEEVVMFDLSEAEVAEMDLLVPGGYQNMLQNIIDVKDIPAMFTEFKKILLSSYGVKSPDGRRFMKGEEIKRAFQESPMYSILFMKIARDEEYAQKFLDAVFPKPKKENNPVPAPALK